MLQQKTSDKKFFLPFSIWWLVWIAVHYSVLLNFGLPTLQSITDSLVSNILLAAFCLLVGNNMRYYLPQREKYWYVLMISFAISTLWLILIRVLLWFIFKKDILYTHMLETSSTVRFSIAFLLVGCMAVMSMLWYSQKEQQEINERKTDTERLSREAELFKLRQQLQPHFLFNSLNSISALAGSHPEKARHMIQQLSDFLRGTLKKNEQHWNTLGEEMQYLQLYLDIEKVRFGHRLQTHIEHDEISIQMKIPSMLLQPVVENAIKFGLYDTVEEVCISITAKSENNYLKVTVQNPFDAETSQPFHGTGFGLASINRRLYLLFARNDLLQTKTVENNFITSISIPQIQ